MSEDDWEGWKNLTKELGSKIQLVGDDVSLQYWAWYGDTRFRVLVSLGPNRGLTALRLIPESTK